MNTHLYQSFILRSNPIIHKNIIKKYGSIKNFYGKNQTGGNLNNENFIFEEFDQNYWTLRDIDGYDCITIGIDPDNKEAFINNINADTVKCGNTILTNQGSHLFKITLKFLIDNKGKDKLNINKIKLTDNAVKICSNSKRINLGFFLTLLTGETWYGKYGFRPIDLDIKKEYRYNRNIMNTTKINDINLYEIINEAYERKSISKKQYKYCIKLYNKYKDQNILVKDFLKKLFKKEVYDELCSVFTELHIIISYKLKLKTNYLTIGEVYELKI